MLWQPLLSIPRKRQNDSILGFTKANIEHIVVELSGPVHVRSVAGNTVFFADGRPCAKVLFEIRNKAGQVRGVTSDVRGPFKFSEAAPGSHDCKATKDGFQSVTGKIIVSKPARRTSKIQIKMEVGF